MLTFLFLFGVHLSSRTAIVILQVYTVVCTHQINIVNIDPVCGNGLVELGEKCEVGQCCTDCSI